MSASVWPSIKPSGYWPGLNSPTALAVTSVTRRKDCRQFSSPKSTWVVAVKRPALTLIVRQTLAATLVLASSPKSRRSIQQVLPELEGKAEQLHHDLDQYYECLFRYENDNPIRSFLQTSSSPLTSPEAVPGAREQIQTQTEEKRRGFGREKYFENRRKVIKEMPVCRERSCTATTEYRARTKIVPRGCGPYSTSWETSIAGGARFGH
ncbi:hypothetical protein EDB81DRAFT_8290 [Dactylonectria macrodidyma]|uniref:Uncharacterized protein n=1 Tax=Dactylonectria macrodidyma TaxID=307937 RepID=A0A9P9FSN4_9HYPO|nr:hypothetical protein EDB81DRAFT_8290 [Dactylonectria macrodidyma]